MQGYTWFLQLPRGRVVFLPHDFDDEEMATYLFIAVIEEFITMETLAIFAALSNLSQREADGGWLVDALDCWCRHP